MTLILSGTDGLSDVDGSAATPAIRGTDANTGIFFPAADTIAFAEGGVEAARFDSSGNVGIGTSSPAYKLDVQGSIGSTIASKTAEFNAAGGSIYSSYNDGTKTWRVGVGIQTAGMFTFRNHTDGTVPVNIDSSGFLLVGTTATGGNNVGFRVYGPYGSINSATATADYSIFNKTTTTTGKQIEFRSADTNVGNITSTSTATQFNTGSSDYRLKDEVSEFTGGLERIKALRPVSFRWKAQDVHDIGFIAHEMQAIVPECVTGEKDAVDSNGHPDYQSIFPAPAQMIATLVSAIQEQQAIITQLQADVAALQAPQGTP